MDINASDLNIIYNFLDMKLLEQNPYLTISEKKFIFDHKELIERIKQLSKADQRIIFSSHKKFIDHKVLLRYNTHILRLELSRIFANYRRKQLQIDLNDKYLMEYNKNGIVVIEDFLTNEVFTKLVEECYNIYEKGSFNIRNKNRKDIITIMDQMGMIEIPKFIQHPVLNHVLTVMTGLKNGEFYKSDLSAITIDVITYNESQRHDIQTDMHTDTFQSTFRWWFYLHDVEMKHGPFHYVKGSHLNDSNRLQWEQEMYQKVKNANPKQLSIGDREGSFRNPDPQIKALETAMVAPKNTLVIADTHGFHHRGIISPGERRFCLFGYTRTDPFYLNP